jgi:hypothetical protein
VDKQPDNLGDEAIKVRPSVAEMLATSLILLRREESARPHICLLRVNPSCLVRSIIYALSAHDPNTRCWLVGWSRPSRSWGSSRHRPLPRASVQCIHGIYHPEPVSIKSN